jgi:putative membrane protein
MYDGGFFFGMHSFWWIFWVIVIAVVVFALLRTSGSAAQAPRETLRETPRETPHEVLRRRYAAGELTTQEYEERKAVLDRDAQAAKSGGPPH